MSVDKKLITPYYYTIPGEDFGCTTCPKRKEPEISYSRYDLYCLRTKIKPTLKREFPGIDGIDIGFRSVEIHDRMVMTLVIRNGAEDICTNELPETTITNIQSAIDEATSYFPKECLIFQASDISILPTDWIIPMLSIVDLPYDIKFRITTLENDAFVYGEFSDDGDYINDADNIQFYILDQLQNMWKQGYIIGAQSIAERWNLQPLIDIEDVSMLEIYKPNWYDVRFAPDPVLFLRDRINNPNGYIKLSLGNNGSNRVLRHIVAEKLSVLQRNLYFDGSDVFITAYSVTDAKEIATKVDIALEEIRSKALSALVFNLSSNDQVKKYLKAMHDYFDFDKDTSKFELPITDRPIPKSETIVYRGTNPSNPYYVSILMPMTTDIIKLMIVIERYINK